MHNFFAFINWKKNIIKNIKEILSIKKMLRRYKEDIQNFIFLNEIYFFFLIYFFNILMKKNILWHVLHLKIIKIDYIGK